MGNRFIVWGRKHSFNRVHQSGDWMGLGAVTPVVTPFPVVAQAPLAAGPQPSSFTQERAPGEGLRRELEVASSIGSVARARGRPRKSAAR